MKNNRLDNRTSQHNWFNYNSDTLFDKHFSYFYNIKTCDIIIVSSDFLFMELIGETLNYFGIYLYSLKSFH